MLLALLLLAGSAGDFGISPLVEPDHSHTWTKVIEDEQGTAWIDEEWSGEIEHNGTPLRLVIMRSDFKGPDRMVSDTMMAVDCDKKLLGMQSVWIHVSTKASGVGAPSPELKMDFAATPPSEEDLAIINFACNSPAEDS
jgi:hypothetical protein